MERLAVIALLIAAGCAPMTPEQCARADWYAEGEADGLYQGISPRFEQRARECPMPDAHAAEQAYLQGWAAGYAEHQRRADRCM